MSAIVINKTGENVGSAYEISDGTFAWNVVRIVGNDVTFRRGRNPTLRAASTALLDGAIALGFDGAGLETDFS
jgi:hypothetical protein